MPYPGGNIIRVTPTLSTDTYADGDVLFVETEIPNVVSSRGGSSILIGMFLVDYKDVSDTDALFVFTEKNTTTIGAINETADIAVANLKTNNLIGMMKLDQDQAGSGGDIDNARMHQVLSMSHAGEDRQMMLSAAPGSTSCYVSGILGSATTPDYDADSWELIFHVRYLD